METETPTRSHRIPAWLLTAQAVAWFALLAGLLLSAAHTRTAETPVGSLAREHAVMAVRPHAEGSAAAVFAARDCWTGAQPAGKRAEAVVVTYTGSMSAEVVDKAEQPRAFEAAAAEAIFGVDSPRIGRVHGFCA